MKFLILNGPNINILGISEPDIYGRNTYEDLVRLIEKTCEQKGIEVEIYQSNTEGFIVDKIQQAYGNTDGIIINPAAYTHTSIALLDAIRAISAPVVEVHLSNVAAREDFRRHSMIAPACVGTIAGFGMDVYRLGVEALLCFTHHPQSSRS